MGKSWMTAAYRESHLTYSHRLRLQPMSKEEQDSFLQAWLFFGFLSEILGDLYREEDFSVALHNGSGKTVSTVTLLSKLAEAWEFPDGTESRDVQIRFEHISDCLQLSSWTLRAAREDFDWGIKYSIASVCELVAHAVREGLAELGITPRTQLYTSWASGFLGKEIGAQMLSGGWCPSSISRASDIFSHLQTLAFLSRLGRSSENVQNHQWCTSKRCNAFQVDLKAYQAKHRESGCHCQEVSPHMPDVIEALERESLPLLRFRSSKGDLESLSIDVIPSSAETPYIAISHVWADGLGNSTSNSLAQCQLLQIGKLVDALSASILQRGKQRFAGYGEGIAPFVWLDTLCCPITPRDAYAVAMSRMRETYEGASYVLVLDAGLQCYSYQDIGTMEALVRVFTSGWMHRLWTLQEGALARKLWVQFKDQAVDLNSLISQLPEIRKTDIRYIPMVDDMRSQYSSLRTFKDSVAAIPPQKYTLEAILAAENKAGAVLAVLDAGLAHRSTSVEADEPLCIANLLDLPSDATKEMLSDFSATATDRMAIVWKHIAAKYGGVPQQILSFDQPRLDKKGFRWALKSLLAVNEEDMYSALTRTGRWKDEKLGVLTEEGLLVTLPGFQVYVRESDDEILRNPWQAFGQIPDQALLFQGDDGIRYQAFTAGDHNPETQLSLRALLRQGTYAIILLNQVGQASPLTYNTTNQQRTWNGLLVHMKRAGDGIFYVDSRTHLLVTDLLPTQAHFYDYTEQLARVLRRDPLTAEISSSLSSSNPSPSPDSLEALKRFFQTAATAALDADPKLIEALYANFGDDDPRILGVYWRIVAEWFFHDFVGKGFGEEQRWCVD